MSLIHVVIKTTKGIVCNIDIVDSFTVECLKEKIADITGNSTDTIILAYKGQFLENELTILSYGIKSGSSIFALFRQNRKPKTEKEIISIKSQNQQQNPMLSFLNSPIGKSMTTMMQENPDIYMNMLQSNPAMKKLVEANPQIQQILNDPNTFDELKSLSSDIHFEQTARTMDCMMNSIESTPRGLLSLTKHMEEVQNPFFESMNEEIYSMKNYKTKISTKAPKKPSEAPLPPINAFPGLGMLDSYFFGPSNLLLSPDSFYTDFSSDDDDDSFYSPLMKPMEHIHGNKFHDEFLLSEDFLDFENPLKFENNKCPNKNDLNEDKTKENSSNQNKTNTKINNKKCKNKKSDKMRIGRNEVNSHEKQFKKNDEELPEKAISLINAGIRKCLEAGLDVTEIPGFEQLWSACQNSTKETFDDYRVKFAAQLKQMNDMGLYDNDVNIEALLMSDGNVMLAVERIFSI
ncbi:hypothetical protein TRFO_35652 [Tritrichomonas foetus]|uniref:Ubiquitin-like domain-containing protein n=1 Tax=Tritrichomonas foetus TaxID=1144522 RepID=A0A1J4JFW0_9EUKA|nr:hypothetical protein TRFO_35652 [Tritrichomonas foetus]|eukprot:OHS98042.1 hypothetical protein TRFO_35652 [Tritrichomonas foetus]